MKTIVLTLAVLLTAISASCAFAQSAPVRGVGLLALNATDSRGNAGNTAGSRMQIEVPDSGGGGHVGARALRGSGDSGSGHDDGGSASASNPTPASTPVAPGDPTTPTAPKRANYRWQALVPGAIK